MRRMIRATWVALASLAMAHPLQAQGSGWREMGVGSEWELYARTLEASGVIPAAPWSIRPFAPAVIDRWAHVAGNGHPWGSRAGVADTAAGRRVLRPAISGSFNTGFPWGFNDGPVWQGKGANAWASAGVEWRWRGISARLEPTVWYASNSGFELDGNTLLDPMRPGVIDLPQRMGRQPVTALEPGYSFVRYDRGVVAIGFSTAPFFWGPGVRHAVLFTGNSGGFPHLFLGTGRPFHTPIGSFHGQLVYGRIAQSRWAPAAPTAARLGTGVIGSWTPVTGLEVGGARFYHRAWPASFTTDDILVPFGSLLGDKQFYHGGPADNQLGTLFVRVSAPRAGLELFGEFARNDRAGDFRDLLVELEHNSAWLLGFLKVIGAPRGKGSYWSLRGEFASARTAEIQRIPRGQATFYDHSVITQGHTSRGQLLGTPLMERAGGVELSLDRWSPRGRVGVTLLERQLPPDLQPGVPADRARSQWDLSVTALRLRGESDFSIQAGHVWDLDRFAGRDGSNLYVRAGWRPSVGR